MSIKGNLEPAFLSGLFQIFCDEKKTGIFSADCADKKVRIHIKDGIIVHASGVGQTHWLADILLHRGILPAEQIDTVTASAKQSGQCICRTLVTLGFLEVNRLTPLLEELARDILFLLLQQTSGEFEYLDTDLDDSIVLIHIPIRNAIMDSFRLLDELSELKTKLPNDDMRFEMVGNAKQNTSYQLDAVAWRILSMVHADQPLSEILRQSSYNAHVVYTTLLALLDAKMITVSTKRKDTGDPETAAEEKNSVQPSPGAGNKSKEKGLLGFFFKKK